MGTDAATRCLVLRPAPEGASLAAALVDAGVDALHFPTLTIAAAERSRLPSDAPDLLLYISPNAVRHGRAALDAAPGARVAAIGAATARALGAAGRRVDITPPGGGYTSEDLLRAPELASVDGWRVWIVRGVGGRELLAQALRERGARVDYVEVYRREPATPTPALLERARGWLTSAPPPLVVATSAETLDNLHRLVPGRVDYRLVTASDRVVKLAQSHGLARPALRAAGPDAASLVECAVQGAARGDDPA